MRLRYAISSTLLALPLSAAALTVDTYSSESDFLAAVGGSAALTLESFSSLEPLKAVASVSSPGVSIVARSGDANGLFAAAPNDLPTDDPALETFSAGDAIVASFSPTITAFGSLVFSQDVVGPLANTIPVTITGSSGGSPFTTTVDVETEDSELYKYLGVVVHGGTISSVQWEAPLGTPDFAAIDDLRFAPVPVPAAWLLLLPALGLLVSRRRQPASA